MFDWIYHNRDVFLSNYVDIGHSFPMAKKLQEDHNHFTLASNVSDSTLFYPLTNYPCLHDPCLLLVRFMLLFITIIILRILTIMKLWLSEKMEIPN